MGTYREKFMPVSARQQEGFARAAAEMKAYIFEANKEGFDIASPEEQAIRVRKAQVALGGFSMKRYNEMTAPYVSAFSNIRDPDDQAAVRQYAVWLLSDNRDDSCPPRFVSIEGIYKNDRSRAPRAQELRADLR